MNIHITNINKTITVFSDESILDALRREGISIRSSCGGFASCSDCIVKISGNIDAVNPVNFDEKKLLGNVFHITKERLACQVKPIGGSDDKDLTVEVVNFD